MKKRHKVLKWISIIVATISLFLGGLLIYVTVREYRPNTLEKVDASDGQREIALMEEFDLLTYNIGYAGLSAQEDFFMDGGKKVAPADKKIVTDNLSAIAKILKSEPADAYFFQEIDVNSTRSYHINEREYFEQTVGIPSMFAYNFKCDYVPYPLPMIGHVESGLATFTDLKVSEASRIALPESFSWPLKTCNLKRCLLESRIPIKGTTKELVLINLHLEAYDNGEGKIAQSKRLAETLEKEYQKGNYVIAGGDFNQTFEGIDKYPIWDKNGWEPGIISSDSLPEGFSFAVADDFPTCRLLNGAYTGSYDTSQVYVIDGFIVSPNVKVNDVSVVNVDFGPTDHQPVKLSVSLKE